MAKNKVRSQAVSVQAGINIYNCPYCNPKGESGGGSAFVALSLDRVYEIRSNGHETLKGTCRICGGDFNIPVKG